MRGRSAFSLSALACALVSIGCNTSGLRRVYMSPDSSGTAERLEFAAGAPAFCIAEIALGDPNVSLKVSMQPLVVNGEKVNLPRLLIAEHLPGKFSGKIATEFPKLTPQAVPDPRDPNQFVAVPPTPAAGRYRCIAELDDEVDWVEFAVNAGEQPSIDPNAPAPGACRAETVASCPLTNPAPNIVRCCTQVGTCGTGPKGTGFCYPSN
jgi:hypothetical protein